MLMISGAAVAYFRMAVPTNARVESKMEETRTAIASKPTGLTCTLAFSPMVSLSEADSFARWGWDSKLMLPQRSSAA